LSPRPREANEELHRESVLHRSRDLTPSDAGEVDLSSNTPEQDALIREVAGYPPEMWFAIAKWAKETNTLQGWQRALAFSLGRLLSNGKGPSVKQATQGSKILAEAKRLGFRAAAHVG
jgi:hypothetical protein